MRAYIQQNLSTVCSDSLGSIQTATKKLLEKKYIDVEEYILTHKEFTFRELLEKQSTKMEIVVTFMVVLELMKAGKIRIAQEKTFGDIYITVVDEEDINGS